MKTKAAVLYKINSPLIIEDVEMPALQKGQVVVKVLATGLCRSQLNEIRGLKGPDPYLPHLLGHEGAGMVEEIGPEVTKVKRGDYVVLSWIKGSGLDALGATYRKGKTAINSGAIATFTEYAVIAENRLTKIPKAVPPDKAALLGCAIATGGGVVLNTFSSVKDRTIAVFGIGGIGASAVLAAKMSGARNIIAVDVSRKKLNFAKKLGATHGVKVGGSEAAFLKRIKDIPGGVDFCLESSGTKTAMEAACAIVKDKGMVVIAGNLKKGETIRIDPFDLIKGKKISGTWGGESVPDRDFPRYAAAYLEGTLPLDHLITHRFRLENINDAFAVLDAGEAGRIVVEFGERGVFYTSQGQKM